MFYALSQALQPAFYFTNILFQKYRPFCDVLIRKMLCQSADADRSVYILRSVEYRHCNTLDPEFVFHIINGVSSLFRSHKLLRN